MSAAEKDAALMAARAKAIAVVFLGPQELACARHCAKCRRGEPCINHECDCTDETACEYAADHEAEHELCPYCND